MKHPVWILLLLLSVTALVYTGGLNGPFLFDDHIHFVQNKQVHISAFDWPSLQQAWNSSFTNFPYSRPLSQLSFGLNHAAAGLEPWAYKATNLAIHLLTGIFVFLFARLAFIALKGKAPELRRKTILFAALTAALWLLHPIQVSTVLYTVQRMAQFSNLAMLIALILYFLARLRLAEGRDGRWLFVAVIPVAVIGFLGKENTVLLPLLLLASELTLLRGVGKGQQQRSIHTAWVILIGFPLAAGLLYVMLHPGLLDYDWRPFTLEERALTQPRALLFYLKWLFIPNPSDFALHHDDIPISTGLFSPASTLPAIVILASLFTSALYLRSKAPVFAFAVLFFLANHALESSIFPLEIIFEHRNYLAALGPLMLLAFAIVVGATRPRMRKLASALGIALLCSYVAVTYLRVGNWVNYNSFILSASTNHPGSPRSNFLAAQLLISNLDGGGATKAAFAEAARGFLNAGIAADERCINCMFGHLILDLHLDKKPAEDMIQRLADTLRSGYVGPTNVSTSQFGYLVKWHRSDGVHLSREEIESIFHAALENPRWNNVGRAGIESALREYYEFVSKDLDLAQEHAQQAINYWPTQWRYHVNLARILHKLGHDEQALMQLSRAEPFATSERQHQEMTSMHASIRQAAGN